MEGGERAQWLRAFVLTDHMGALLSTHMMTQNYLQLRFQKIRGHLLTSVGIKHPHVTDMYIQTKHSHMLTKEIYKKKK